MEQTIKSAKIAEDALGIDPLHQMLLEALTRNASLADKQTAQISDLAARVSALSDTDTQQQQSAPAPGAGYYAPVMYEQQLRDPTALSGGGGESAADRPPTGQRSTVSNGQGAAYQSQQQPPPQQRGGYGQRQPRPTPQNAQRANYARQQQQLHQQHQPPPSGGRNFNDRRQVRFNDEGEACRNCLRVHREGEVCYAANESCRRCGQLGHYARCCRAVRRD